MKNVADEKNIDSDVWDDNLLELSEALTHVLHNTFTNPKVWELYKNENFLPVLVHGLIVDIQRYQETKIDNQPTLNGGNLTEEAGVAELFDLYIIKRSKIYPYSPELWAIGDSVVYGGKGLKIRINCSFDIENICNDMETLKNSPEAWRVTCLCKQKSIEACRMRERRFYKQSIIPTYVPLSYSENFGLDGNFIG